MDEKHCIHCNKTRQEVALIELLYQNNKYYICSAHLPILLHHPEKLADKMPGAEYFGVHKH